MTTVALASSKKTPVILEEIQKNIGLFYENAKGISLKGSHIIKMNIDENSDSISEIFSYTYAEDNDRVRNQERELCIKVDCCEMNLKAEGYQVLFDYTKKNSLLIKNIYEAEKEELNLNLLKANFYM